MSRRLRKASLGLGAVSIVCALSPSVASAAPRCWQWNLTPYPRGIQIVQNNGFRVNLNFAQNGMYLNGPAEAFGESNLSRIILRGTARGQVTTRNAFGGLVDVPKVLFQIDWVPAVAGAIRGTGVYAADVLPDGRLINHRNWDTRTPRSLVGWAPLNNPVRLNPGSPTSTKLRCDRWVDV